VVLARLAPGAAPLLLLPRAVPHRSGARAASAAADQRGVTAAAAVAVSIGLGYSGCGGPERRDGLTGEGICVGFAPGEEVLSSDVEWSNASEGRVRLRYRVSAKAA
jgi:hypothetical protein